MIVEHCNISKHCSIVIHIWSSCRVYIVGSRHTGMYIDRAMIVEHGNISKHCHQSYIYDQAVGYILLRVQKGGVVGGWGLDSPA